MSEEQLKDEALVDAPADMATYEGTGAEDFPATHEERMARSAALREQSFQELCEAGYTHTLSVTLSYQGAPFAGFARQAEENLMTVQGELERALELLYRREVKTTCAGRTDAGVHARRQVVSYDVTDEELELRPLYPLIRSLNALVDDHISIYNVEERPLGFSARFDAKWREYHYHICTDVARPVLIKPIVWHLGGVQLDIDAMNEAAQYIIGEHDFKSFCMSASAVGKPTHRNVMKVEVYPEVIAGTEVITLRVVGSAFLHSMIRIMVGTLVEVGRGRKKPEWVRDVLAVCDRRAAGQTAPASGLVFWDVSYE